MAVTYQHAYIAGTTTLCRRHAEYPPEWVPVLGPVSHGDHDAACDACGRSVPVEEAPRMGVGNYRRRVRVPS
jgi:hypothetical protein